MDCKLVCCGTGIAAAVLLHVVLHDTGVVELDAGIGTAIKPCVVLNHGTAVDSTHSHLPLASGAAPRTLDTAPFHLAACLVFFTMLELHTRSQLGVKGAAPVSYLNVGADTTTLRPPYTPITTPRVIMPHTNTTTTTVMPMMADVLSGFPGMTKVGGVAPLLDTCTFTAKGWRGMCPQGRGAAECDERMLSSDKYHVLSERVTSPPSDTAVQLRVTFAITATNPEEFDALRAEHALNERATATAVEGPLPLTPRLHGMVTLAAAQRLVHNHWHFGEDQAVSVYLDERVEGSTLSAAEIRWRANVLHDAWVASEQAFWEQRATQT